MPKRKFKCPESDYWYLQKRRKDLIQVMVMYRWKESVAEETRRLGLLNYANKYYKEARKWLKVAKELEEEIKELEVKCFVQDEEGL